MKKLFCIFALFVFLPCSVPAADGATDTEKTFQIAKAYKLFSFEKQDFYGRDRLLNNRPDRTDDEEAGGGGTSDNKSVRTCPAGKYRKNGGACVSFCSGIQCTTGSPSDIAGGCCCQ